MSVDALPFVNWIFWAALTSGSMLVVGVTELLGGTTRGYRLFMAWLLAAFAIVLVASDLALPLAAEAAATTGVRRPLTILFAGGCLTYLVASVWTRPRTWVAIVAGAVGLAAMVALAAGGPSRSVPLFALQLVIAALALGAVHAAMLLGHWYLVTPKLSPAPLRRMMWLLIGALLGQGLLFALSVMLVGPQAVEGGIAWLTWLRLIVGIVLPIGITVLAILASRAASLQASTGLLYIGLALVMAGSIAGASISYLTGVPV
jgi:hypothetical protein